MRQRYLDAVAVDDPNGLSAGICFENDRNSLTIHQVNCRSQALRGYIAVGYFVGFALRDGVSVLVERGGECVELEEVSRELCLAHSSFQGATLVGPGKVSMETIVKGLMHEAMGKFRG